MKILIYRWKAYNYKDIIDTFEALGHQVEIISQKLLSYDVDEAFAQKLFEKIRTEGFDFVFSVNYFALISNVCQELGLPYVCWSCDNPLISMYHKSVFNACNRIFLFDKSSVEEFKAMGVKQVYYLPLAVNCKRLSQVISSATDLGSYRNDISFVGSLYEKNAYDEIEGQLSDYLRGYFEAVIEAQRDMQGMNIVERMLTPEILMEIEEHFKLEKSEDSLSDLGLVFATNALGFKIAREQRKSILLTLARKHQVALYTGSDASDLMRVQVKPPVDYWLTMPKVFNQSKINLNMTIPNIKTGIPLRVFDVLGSGGFLITNFQAELPMLFENEKHLVYYLCQEDLQEKVAFYMKHDSLRADIAEAGLTQVKKSCRYEDRINTMLDIIFSHI